MRDNLQKIVSRRKALKIRLLAALLGLVIVASGAEAGEESQTRRSTAATTRLFSYTGKRFGVPILQVSLRVDPGFWEAGRLFSRVQASVTSLPALGFFFRMNNYFTSLMDLETCCPVRYVKEVNQEGLFVQKKKYLQNILFDPSGRKVVAEYPERREKQEVILTSDTFDPLSMFGRYYLKEDLFPGRNVLMSIYDGVRLRQMVFQVSRERVNAKRYGEVEAFRVESMTSFSSFGEREGTIRIWYTADGRKTPIAMEVALPVGNLVFELDSEENG